MNMIRIAICLMLMVTFTSVGAINNKILLTKPVISVQKTDSESGKNNGALSILINSGQGTFHITVFGPNGSEKMTGNTFELKNLSTGKYILVVQNLDNEVSFEEINIDIRK